MRGKILGYKNMYSYIMMYVHEILSGYACAWEKKSLTVVGDSQIFCREEMLENNSARTILWGKRYSVGRPADLEG